VCLDGCEGVDSVIYSFNVFKNLGNETTFIWLEATATEKSTFMQGILNFILVIVRAQHYKNSHL
jgi:hypothetical protein